ncbi:nitroreductase family protein [Myxococcota bacterium]|nr:nitroreductase family protein [Myxococcota bacterium]MBU1380645.1 nitroreductase family protein [Myxococcota bacterium]MBU1496987.1 nitroreductase family protein [Myxococcota bacterium]
MSKLMINEQLCTKCGTCSDFCVTKIISTTSDGWPEISPEKALACIMCGHCESFCPSKALTLDFNVEAKLKTKEKNQIQIDLESLFKNRRSIRHFKSDTVKSEDIEKIIDIARYAPTGGNSQTVQWTIVQNSNDVKTIASLTVEWLKTIINSDHPLSDFAPFVISMFESGMDIISNGAPCMVFSHIPENKLKDATDSIIAMSHFDLIAPAYGVGTCWAGFVLMALNGYAPLREFLSLENRLTGGAVMIGYPVLKPVTIPGRKSPAIIYKHS